MSKVHGLNQRRDAGGRTSALGTGAENDRPLTRLMPTVMIAGENDLKNTSIRYLPTRGSGYHEKSMFNMRD
jgi:hypothetical protein